MNRRNKGISESDILQNQFTAYLKVSLRRCKNQHLANKNKIATHEVYSLDEYEGYDNDFAMMIAENDALHAAFGRISEKERLVVILRIVEQKSFKEVAISLGMKYSSVTTIYHRAIDKLRIILTEDEKRL